MQKEPTESFPRSLDGKLHVPNVEYAILSGRYTGIKKGDEWIRGAPQRRLTSGLFGACPFKSSRFSDSPISERAKNWIGEYETTIGFVPQIVGRINSVHVFRSWLNKRPALLQAIASYEPYIVFSEINNKGLFKMSYSEAPPKNGEEWILMNVSNPNLIESLRGDTAKKIAEIAVKMNAVAKSARFKEIPTDEIKIEIRKASLAVTKSKVSFSHAMLDSDRSTKDLRTRFTGKVFSYGLGKKPKLGPIIPRG